VIEKKMPLKLDIIPIKTGNDINRKIHDIYSKYIEFKIIPYFSWDTNSKYSIKFFNKTYWIKINPQIFKKKNEMMRFLWDIAKKKFIQVNYKDLFHLEIEELREKIGDSCIIKPIDASSSVSTFKLWDISELLEVRRKLSKKYDYIIEEYIWWELYSLDFFFDGENAFFLSFMREIAMIELSDKKKFSKSFLDSYGEEIEKHFQFIIPIRYNLDFSKISLTEVKFLNSIILKLKEIWYRWPIHLEYKYDKKTNKIWFIEWGARYGWKRVSWMKKIYQLDSQKIPHYTLIQQDFSKFQKIWKSHLYIPIEQEPNINLIGCKTNFIGTTNYISILKKMWGIFDISVSQFLKDYYFRVFGIKVQNIDFYAKYSSWYNFFPFYINNETRFDYILELDDKNFELFKLKKFQIIEKTFFHDYK